MAEYTGCRDVGDRCHSANCGDRFRFANVSDALKIGFCAGNVGVVFAGIRPTLGGKIHSREAARMTWFEIYALFGSPLILLVLCLVMVWLTGLQDNRDTPHKGAAE